MSRNVTGASQRAFSTIFCDIFVPAATAIGLQVTAACTLGHRAACPKRLDGVQPNSQKHPWRRCLQVSHNKPDRRGQMLTLRVMGKKARPFGRPLTSTLACGVLHAGVVRTLLCASWSWCAANMQHAAHQIIPAIPASAYQSMKTRLYSSR